MRQAEVATTKPKLIEYAMEFEGARETDLNKDLKQNKKTQLRDGLAGSDKGERERDTRKN